LGRHYGMDWLRIAAFGLLIFYHIALVFVTWPYHAKTAHPIDWVSVPMQAVNAWRLPLLFVVSGYASRAIFAGCAGSGDFAWGRTKRLIPPLLFGVIVIVPPQPWVELSTQHGYTASFWHFWTKEYFKLGTLGGIVLPTWNHLWFVVYLWIYTMALAIGAALLPRRVSMLAVRAVEWVMSGPFVVIVPIALLMAQMAWTFPGVRETHALVDDGPVHRVYATMFLFGFVLRGSDRIWVSIRRWWPAGLVLGLIGYGVVATLEIRFMGPPQMSRALWFAFGLARAVQSWGIMIALVGMADRWLNHDHPARAMLNEAVFPFYLIHQTIIVVVAGALLRAHIGPLAEFVILVAATAAGCWAFYRMGREIGWLRPLIGLRGRRAGRTPRAAGATS